MLYAIVALLVIILDQWTKYWVMGNITLNTGIEELIPGVVSLMNVHNDGAAFSILSGANARMVFIIVCAVFTLLVIVALATNLIKGQVGRWSAVFVMAGGIGNCIDRVLYGYVQDMFRLDCLNNLIGKLTGRAYIFPIFNVADVFITVFCIVFIFYILFGGNRRAALRQAEDEYEDEDEPVDEPEEEKVDVLPARRPREKAENRARKPQYEQDYDELKASRAARQSEPVDEPAPPVDPNDPFAEWERSLRAGKSQKAAPAAKEKPVVQVRAVAKPEPVVEQPRVAEPAPAPVKEAPVAAPAATPGKPASSEDEFSLDDILAEFR